MTSPAFTRAAVIGAGVMGHGIALVHALGGTDVTLCDLSSDMLNSAVTQIAAACETLVAGGVIDAGEARVAQARIATTTDLKQALSGADMVVEAITENPKAKAALFGLIATHAAHDAVIASNTSYLDIFPLVPDSLQARVFIVHWYTPPYVIDLVDVVAAAQVPPDLTAKVVGFLMQMGKTPVVLKKFIPGYVANRIQMAIESEIFHLLDAGIAEPQEIDQAISEGLALRLALFGQFKKIDYTGVKIVRDSHDLGVYVPPTPPTLSVRLDEMVESGFGGVTHGKGFYDYLGRDPVDLYRERDLDLLALKKAMSQIKKLSKVRF